MAPEDRAAFLEKECAHDPERRALLERLLKSFDEAGDFLTPRADEELVSDPAHARRHEFFEGPGTRIGPYRILREIGEGGFGVVFLAKQEEPVVRRVALKVIKLGMDTRQVIARFEAERQALALMEHPNIAKVLDAGATDGGRPYFVMEYVDGEPITDYCDRNALDTRERLRLFVDICGAIQHAHQKGIIHRDIKPANILVATADGRAIPKVIDFGIAKATGARLTEKTMFTEHHQLIGTPQYMSPEQADLAAVDIDTRSDIYSLGVLLYELLTGTTPFDERSLRAAAFSEVQRILREVEPPKPSTRLGRLGEDLTAVASRRNSDPIRLARQVRGDLDWIVMKALEKERARRYETANGLARDIERHLLDEPVTVGPPSRSYRVRKFVRRNRRMVLAVSAVGLALVLGIAGTSTGLVRALRERTRADDARAAETKEREHAEAEAARSRLVLDVMRDLLQPSQTRDSTGAPLSFVERVREVSRSVARRVGDRAEAESQVRSLLGGTFEILEADQDAELEFQRVLSLQRRLHGELDPAVTSALTELYRATSVHGGAARAASLVRDAVEQVVAAGRDEEPEMAELLQLLARAQIGTGELAAAEANSRRALVLRERFGGHHQIAVANSLELLATIALRTHRWKEAAAFGAESLALYRSLKGELARSTSDRVLDLAQVARESGDRAGAIVILRDSVQRARDAMPAAPSIEQEFALARRLTWEAVFLGTVPDRLPEMEAAILESLRVHGRIGDLDPVGHGEDLIYLGILCWIEGRLDEAEAHLRESLAMARTHEGERGQHWAAAALTGLSLVSCGQGRFEEAVVESREAFATTAKYATRPFWTVWLCGYELAMAVRLGGDVEEARSIEGRMAAMIPKAGVIRTYAVALRTARVGEYLIDQAEFDRAEPILAECDRIWRDIGPEHWRHHELQCALARCLAAQARFDQGEPLLVEGLVCLEADPATPPETWRRALRHAIDFYAGWDAAEAGKGHDLQLAEWDRRLAALDSWRAPSERNPR
jgi:serine/threonine protein kinase/tetratricopeptide (TPR) repeat protein